MGFLYDGVTEVNARSTNKVLGLYNRGSYGTGHGWAAAHSVAWNCNVNEGWAVIEKPPTAQNYAIGCRGTISGGGPFNQPDGFIELSGRADLEPASLYHQQLFDRLQVHPILPVLNTPADFTSLGTIDVTTDALSFDTDALEVSGGLAGKGELLVLPSGRELAVFTFVSIDLQTSPVIIGKRGIAFLSLSDMTFDADLDLSGGTAVDRRRGRWSRWI